MSNRMKMKLASLALGGTSLVVTGIDGGCQNYIIAETVRGVGNAGIVAGIDAIFGAVNSDPLNTYVKEPMTDAMTGTWNNYVNVRWPITAVSQEIFTQ